MGAVSTATQQTHASMLHHSTSPSNATQASNLSFTVDTGGTHPNMTKENLYGKPAPRFPEHWIWQTEFWWHATAQQHLHSRLSSHCLIQSASVCHNHVVLSQLRTCLLSLVLIEQQHSGPLITDVSLDAVFWSQNTENIVLPSILSYSVELYICKKKKKKKKVTTSWYCSVSSITDSCGWWRGKSWASCVSRHILLYMPHLTLLLLFFEVPPAEQMCMWEGWEGTQWTCCKYANVYGAEKCPIFNNYKIKYVICN